MKNYKFSLQQPFAAVNGSEFPEQTPLAMAYVPFQSWSDTYDEETAFCQGTVFPNLDFPFCQEDCNNE